MKDETALTQMLKDVLHKTKHLSMIEQLNALKQAWMKYRQIGCSEAVYRLLSALHLISSNISCIFVASGYPENRSVFFQKVNDNSEKIVELDNSFDEDQDEDSEDELIDNNDEKKPVKIAGRDGKFKEAISIHERYAKRPDYLEEMCLAQFASVYVLTPRMKKGTKWSEEEGKEGCSVEASTIAMFKKDKDDKDEPNVWLPRYIDLRKFKLGLMRARCYPIVLRTHNSRKKDGDEFYYAELQLYFHWRDEDKDLRSKDNEKHTIDLYYNQEVIKTIDSNKAQLYVGYDAGELLEEAELYRKDEDRPTLVFDMLNAQTIQENEDDEEEGVVDDPEFAGRNPGELSEKGEGGALLESSRFKKLILPDDDELLEMTRRLVPEQLAALTIFLKYCKSIKRNHKNPFFQPDAPRLIIHGGAGKHLMRKNFESL